MSIDSTLKREGIEVLGELNTLDVNKIAKNISEKICKTFPEHNINQSELFISIARLNMYIAKMPDINSGAKYYYKNNSIYFNKDMDIDTLSTLSIHECIHFIQEVKSPRGKLLRLGLYNLSEKNKPGMGINEAAVQLMASKANGEKPDTVKYYNMEFSTDSPNFYPIETALVKEMMFFTGSYPLYHSTLYSNDVFKNTFNSIAFSNTYQKIEYKFDLLLHYQEDLAITTNKIANLPENGNLAKLQKLNDRVYLLKEIILQTTLEIQNIIMRDCFDSELSNARNIEDINKFNNHLQDFSKILIENKNDTSYQDYFNEIQPKIQERISYIQKYGDLTFFEASNSLELAPLEDNTYGFKFFKSLFSKLSLLVEERLRSKEL